MNKEKTVKVSEEASVEKRLFFNGDDRFDKPQRRPSSVLQSIK